MVNTRSYKRAAAANAIPDVDSTPDTRDNSDVEDSLPNQPSPAMAPSLSPLDDQSISAALARRHKSPQAVKELLRESAQKASGSNSRGFESISCVGEIPKKDATSLKKTFEMVWNILDKELGPYSDVVIFNQTMENLNSIRGGLTEVEDFRKYSGDPTATVISFSSLTWPKLQNRLGVKRPPPNQISREQIKSIMDRAAQAYKKSEGQDIYAKAWNHTSVFKNLQWIDELVLKRKEASARISINEWILELGQYLKNDNYWVLIIPELTLQDAKDKNQTSSNFSTISYGNMNTALTGVSDYALIAQSDDDWKEPQFLYFKEAAIEASSLMSLAGLLKYANIVVVEAKDILTERLEAHTSQVVGQCIAILNSDSKRDAVPFYLTNGKIWIFGVVSRCPPDENVHLYESFVFPAFTVSTEDVSQPGVKVETQKYDTFIRTLITWAKLKPSKIVEAIKEEIRLGRA